MTDHSYICSVHINTSVPVESPNYDEAIQNALYKIMNEMKSRPDRFIEKNLGKVECFLLSK